MKLFSSSSGNGKRSNSTTRTLRSSKNINREPVKAYAAAGSTADAQGVIATNSRVKKIEKQKMKENDKKTTSKALKRLKVALIVVLIFATVMLGAGIGFGYYVSTIDTIFPNISIEGVNLAGLSPEAAAQRLIASGYESNADAVAVTVVFPDGTSFNVTGPEVGLSRNAAQAVARAFNIGRDGSFIENTIAFVQSNLEPVELKDIDAATLDDTIIRDRASDLVTQFNSTLFNNNLEITDTQINFLKGTEFQHANVESVFDLALMTIRRATEENTHLTVNYVPDASVEEGIDLQSLFNSIFIEPVSSEFSVELMGGTESSNGRMFDLEEAQMLVANAGPGDTVVIPIIETFPEYTKEQVDAMLFRDVIAERTTTIGGSANRRHNIITASEYINGKILLPGEVFSFNEVVGQRTAARGFREAGVIVSGELVDGIGGGICQVSSTMYAALLTTTVDFVERRPHGLSVSYLPLGQDATVAFWTIDFKFKNTYNFPMKIETIVDGSTMIARFIGTRENENTIELETVRISTTDVVLVEIEDPNRPLGERFVRLPGQVGHVVETFQRIYSPDGELLERVLVTRDTYRMQNREIHVGTYVPAAPEPTPPPPPPTDPPPAEDPPPEQPPAEEPQG